MRIGIDIGGTFTDVVLFDEEMGVFRTHKILSTPGDPAQAVLDGLAAVQDGAGSGAAQPPPAAALWIVHGSTVATNALLERKGARTALVTTRGFRDVLTIGRQTRSAIYDFFADRPEPLIPDPLRLEVDERVDHHGQVLRSLDPSELPSLVEQLRRLDVESVAVCLLFSFLHPQHEHRIAQALRAAGFFVSPSSEILPEFREYERASTTAINAYVSPILDRYLGRLGRQLRGASLRIMQSNGGSIRADQARSQAVRSILSGPAGGVVGAQYVAQAAGFAQAITFDMGGTSTDVSLCDGAIRVTSEAEIGGLPIRIPVIDIHTVGSGGGSIAYVDPGGALRVGPRSAGADPGPACYGRGGQQPTVTDAHLVLGRLAADYFLGGRMALDVEASWQALDGLARRAGLAQRSGTHGLSPAQRAALGVIQVVNAHMERALRVISVERGYDPQDFVLVSFGGAGGLHAPELARALGIRRVLVPAGASTLSAFGMLTADVVKDYVQTVMLPGTTDYDTLESRLAQLARRGQREVEAEGVAPSQVRLQRELDMRYVGQSYELTISLTPDFVANFHAAHDRAYGYSDSHAPLEIVNLRLRAVGAVRPPPMPRGPGPGTRWQKLSTGFAGMEMPPGGRKTGEEFPPSCTRGLPPPAAATDASAALLDQRPVVLAAGPARVPFYRGERLCHGHAVPGPAVILQPDTTLFLESGDHATLDEHSNLVIEVGSIP